MRKKIVVFGSFVEDLMGRASHLPVTGETVFGSMFKMGSGGKGANQAVAAKRAGADVVLITKIGDDGFGEMALDGFKSEGIETDYVIIGEGLKTGIALIMVDENTSENKILVVPGACTTINDADMQKAKGAIEDAECLLTQLEVNMDAIEKAIDIAHQKGIKIILNPAPVQSVADDLLKKVYCVTPNEIEAGILTGICVNSLEAMRQAAQYFFSKGVKKVVITLGDKGVYAHDGQEDRLMPPLSVDVLDTTGAGDAFNGAFACALCEEKDFFEAVQFGNHAAALSVTKIGTAISTPYRHEINAFLEG